MWDNKSHYYKQAGLCEVMLFGGNFTTDARVSERPLSTSQDSYHQNANACVRSPLQLKRGAVCLRAAHKLCHASQLPLPLSREKQLLPMELSYPEVTFQSQCVR